MYYVDNLLIISVQIENYSNMLLSDAQVEFRCPANNEKNENIFEELKDIQPLSREDISRLTNDIMA